MNLNGIRGLAYRNRVAQVRCITVVHLRQDEARTIAAGLRWVAVNLAALDDEQHQQPLATCIDTEMEALRRMDIWVSAPAGNNNYTQGISWPACQKLCMGIGATQPGTCSGVLAINFASTDFATNTIRLELDTSLVPEFNLSTG